jgi:hypothetical protein
MDKRGNYFCAGPKDGNKVGYSCNAMIRNDVQGIPNALGIFNSERDALGGWRPPPGGMR